MHKPPATLDEAWPRLEPFQSLIWRCWQEAHRQVVPAFHGRPGAENRTVKGAYVDWAVEAAHAAFGPLEAKGEVSWLDLNGLRLLRIAPGVMLWWKTVNENFIPRRNGTLQSYNAWSQQMQLQQMLPFGEEPYLAVPEDCTLFLAAANVDVSLATEPRIAIVHQSKGRLLGIRYLDNDAGQMGVVLPMAPAPQGDPSQRPAVASDLQAEAEAGQ